MARGNMPRQPSRSGRQEGARRANGARPVKGRHQENARPGSGPTCLKTGKAPKAAAAKKKVGFAAGGAANRAAAYDPVAPKRVRQIIAGLDQLYPEVTCALTHRTAWELLVATILSAQSTDVRVNMVTPGLFAKYPTVQDFAALEPEQLQPDIYSTGFFRNKAKSVVGAARKIVADFGGNVRKPRRSC